MASKTIDNMDFYVSIKPYKTEGNGEQVFDSLRVSVGYRKGRGFYVGYHPGWGGNSMWGCVFDFSGNPLTAGATIYVEQATKNSAKRIAEMFGSVKQADELIRWFFDRREWSDLDGVLKATAAHGFNAEVEKLYRGRMENQKQKDNSINNQNETTMNENVKAADLIGKVIVVGDNIATITIKGVNDSGNLEGEFVKGDQPAIMMPVTLANLKAMLERGVWRIEGEASAQTGPAAATADDDVQEVEDVQPAKPTAKPKTEKPKSEKARPQGKAEPKAKTKTEPKAKMQDSVPHGNGQSSARPKAACYQRDARMVNGQCSKLTYETYTSSKGKACARILGFKEDDAAYKNAADIHGSASWNTTKDGRVLYVAFGPRYAAAAKQVCDALNSGKSFDDCKAIIEGKTAAPQGDKTYTLDEVAAKLKKLLPDGDKATIEDIKKLLEAA